MIDHATIDDLLNEIEDEDDSATAKKGLSVLQGGKGGPADSDGSNRDDVTRPVPGDTGGTLATDKPDDKLQALVAALSPEEKAKLRAMLDADDEGPAPKGA